MENSETSNLVDNSGIMKVEINKISLDKFILLSVITFGLYGLWWIYKSWRFFQDKDKSEIMPAMRALFSIFFLIPLFNKILKLANSSGYKQKYISTLLFIGYIIWNLLAELPEPYFLIAIFSFVFLVPPFKALNFAVDYCDGFKVNEQKTYNGRQIFLLIIGGIFWILVLIGLFK